MNKDIFLKLIHTITDIDKSYDALFKLGINIIDYPLLNKINGLISDIIKEAYGTDGLDWIEWWIYEKSADSSIKAFETDDDGNKIEINKTLDELYDYLERYCSCN